MIHLAILGVIAIAGTVFGCQLSLILSHLHKSSMAGGDELSLGIYGFFDCDSPLNDDKPLKIRQILPGVLGLAIAGGASHLYLTYFGDGGDYSYCFGLFSVGWFVGAVSADVVWGY
ncbi:MAG: hypothetical protein FWD51_06680 [Betaproteobacteria bacterium]|nr:hypothetical protein [Betaproteobacteria bacterium]